MSNPPAPAPIGGVRDPSRCIILLAGGTGVGTSTFAPKLSHALGIPNVVNTDCIRQVLRTAIHPSVNAALTRSTYLAGHDHGYGDLEADQQRWATIRGFELQCAPILTAVEGIIQRTIKENRPLVIEGVHLIPGFLRQTDWYEQVRDHLIELFLYIDDTDVHRERFIYRQLRAPERNMDIYLKNFREIRWIHDWLHEHARRDTDAVCVNNDKHAADCLEALMGRFGAVPIAQRPSTSETLAPAPSH